MGDGRAKAGARCGMARSLQGRGLAGYVMAAGRRPGVACCCGLKPSKQEAFLFTVKKKRSIYRDMDTAIGIQLCWAMLAWAWHLSITSRAQSSQRPHWVATPSSNWMS